MYRAVCAPLSVISVTPYRLHELHDDIIAFSLTRESAIHKICARSRVPRRSLNAVTRCPRTSRTAEMRLLGIYTANRASRACRRRTFSPVRQLIEFMFAPR